MNRRTDVSMMTDALLVRDSESSSSVARDGEAEIFNDENAKLRNARVSSMNIRCRVA